MSRKRKRRNKDLSSKGFQSLGCAKPRFDDWPNSSTHARILCPLFHYLSERRRRRKKRVAKLFDDACAPLPGWRILEQNSQALSLSVRTYVYTYFNNKKPADRSSSMQGHPPPSRRLFFSVHQGSWTSTKKTPGFAQSSMCIRELLPLLLAAECGCLIGPSTSDPYECTLFRHVHA